MPKSTHDRIRRLGFELLESKELLSAIPLTWNASPETNLDFADQCAIWTSHDGADDELYFFNGASTRRITDNSVKDHSPDTDGGSVVWISGEGTSSEIFFYDGTDTLRLTENLSEEQSPALFTGRVAWSGWDGNDWEIYLYESGVTTQITDNTVDDREPHLDATSVVWIHGNGFLTDIQRYNGIDISTIDSPFDENYSPFVYGNRIAWTVWDGNDEEILLHENGSTSPLTNNTRDDWNAIVSAELIIWQHEDASDEEIYYYDGNQVRALTSNSTDDFDPSLDGDRIAWTRWDGSDFEIMLYGGSTQSAFTSNEVMDESPHLDEGSIVWTKTSLTSSEVFLFPGPAPVELGIVDYLDLNNEPGIDRSLLYTVTAARTGVMTLIGEAHDPTNDALLVMDQSGDLLASSELVEENYRLDLLVEEGVSYQIVVVGDPELLDFQILNQVSPDDTQINIYGSNRSEVFYVSDPSLQCFAIDDIEYDLQSLYLPQLQFEAGAGDKLQIQGTADSEMAFLSPNYASISGSGWRVKSSGHTSVEYDADAGQDDVTLFGSAGSDLFSSRNGIASLSGAGYENTAARFTTLQSKALTGDQDRAVLAGSSGNDRLLASLSIARLDGPNLSQKIDGFELTEVLGNQGGWDSACFLGEDGGSETFLSTDQWSSLFNDAGHRIMALDFESTDMRFATGATDADVRIYDSPHNDSFSAKGTSLQGDFGRESSIRIQNFKNAELQGSRGLEHARIYDAAINDEYSVAESEVTVSQAGAVGPYLLLKNIGHIQIDAMTSSDAMSPRYYGEERESSHILSPIDIGLYWSIYQDRETDSEREKEKDVHDMLATHYEELARIEEQRI
jgi:hypothetical protein